MELLLNLAWLLLMLPAYWLWRGTRAGQRISSGQCLLALGCTLVLLFPVVSVTDDLHAMRAEMEESSTNKRSMRQAGNEKGSLWNSRGQNPPVAGIQVSFLVALGFEGWQDLRSPTFRFAVAPRVLRAGRAPPQFSLV